MEFKEKNVESEEKCLYTTNGDFRSKVLGMTEDEKIRQNRLDIRGYMKYILEKGALQEKRELMQSFTSKFVLINKRIILE